MFLTKSLKKYKAEQAINSIKSDTLNAYNNTRLKTVLHDVLTYMYRSDIPHSMIKNTFLQLCTFLDRGDYNFVNLTVNVSVRDDGTKKAIITHEEII